MTLLINYRKSRFTSNRNKKRVEQTGCERNIKKTKLCLPGCSVLYQVYHRYVNNRRVSQYLSHCVHTCIQLGGVCVVLSSDWSITSHPHLDLFPALLFTTLGWRKLV